jgi:hypothetical protein
VYIDKVVLTDVRCFRELVIDFSKPGESILIAADNGDGKTTLLRSIAMGLCDESSAAALFRELPGEFVRRNAREAHIDIFLRDQGDKYRICTTIQSLKAFERPNQEVFKISGTSETELDQDTFPWERIFVCGYGAGRQTQGTSNIDDYAAVDAVYTLFRYYEPLRNPELAIHRLLEKARTLGGKNEEKREQNAEKLRARLLDLLKGVMNLEADDMVILTHKGIEVKSRWGRAKLHSLGDGYASATTLILDFISCRMLSSRSLDPASITGIMLIDEVEQHLHPKWQLQVMQLLKEAFPRVQFIATTHSPLVISGCKTTKIHTLNRGKHRIFNGAFGWLAEDVYQEVMGLPDSRAGSFSQDILERYELLHNKMLEGKDTRADRNEFKRLRRQLGKLPEGDPVTLTTEISNITNWLRKREGRAR